MVKRVFTSVVSGAIQKNPSSVVLPTVFLTIKKSIIKIIKKLSNFYSLSHAH